MCGIAGLFYKNQIHNQDVRDVLKMSDAIKHRGPDDEGVYSDQTCVLAHRRLSIIDLSKDGHQPFISKDRRYHLVYNGELYNYIELRRELEDLGVQFYTQTDTEVLLAAFIQYKEKCLEKFNGMFAFAVYDSQTQEIFCARDRFGIKPLYYCTIGEKFYFASEIKSFKCIDGFSSAVNQQAVFDYLVFNRTDVWDETFLSNVRRLPKGCWAKFSGQNVEISQWWNPKSYIGVHFEIDPVEAISRIHELMRSSVAFQMRSDVKVGACLSGGLDSSILVGCVLDNFKTNFPTFTVSFPGYSFDESKYIDAFNQDHAFLNFRTYPKEEDLKNTLDDFIFANDEPTPSASFFAQYEVMRLAKRNRIKVLLDGQGGDENFAGYGYFYGFLLDQFWREKNFLRFASTALRSFALSDRTMIAQTFFFQRASLQNRKKILQKYNQNLNNNFFDKHISQSKIFNDFFDISSLNESLCRHFQYKLEHLLRMEDRNSMTFSVEARVPYLDHRLVEFLLGLPGQMKLQKGQLKYLQKQALGQYSVPKITRRKDKIGFNAPIDDWMSKPFWQQEAQESQSFLSEVLPEVFSNKNGFEVCAKERWKIIQLARWYKKFI